MGMRDVQAEFGSRTQIHSCRMFHFKVAKMFHLNLILFMLLFAFMNELFNL